MLLNCIPLFFGTKVIQPLVMRPYSCTPKCKRLSSNIQESIQNRSLEDTKSNARYLNYQDMNK